MASGDMAERPAEAEGASTAEDSQWDSVIKSWMGIRGLMERAGRGKMIRIPDSGLDRQAVIDNADLLEPLVASVGALTNVEFGFPKYEDPNVDLA